MHAKGLGNGDHATPRELKMEGLQARSTREPSPATALVAHGSTRDVIHSTPTATPEMVQDAEHDRDTTTKFY